MKIFVVFEIENYFKMSNANNSLTTNIITTTTTPKTTTPKTTTTRTTAEILMKKHKTHKMIKTAQQTTTSATTAAAAIAAAAAAATTTKTANNAAAISKANIFPYKKYKKTSNKFLLITIVLVFIKATAVACARERIKTELEAKVGSHVVFNCQIDFPYDQPIPYVVHWSKDSKRIFTWYDGVTNTSELFIGRLNLVTNNNEYGKASANLTAIRESDQGSYHCQIIFTNRTPSIRNNGTFYHLTVQGGSLIKIPPVNQTIMEGQTAFFHCVMKYPETSTASWYKDGVLLQDVQDLVRRSYMGPDGSLSIDPTMMSDLGEYVCNVRNNEGEIQTAKAFLNIQYKAKVIYAPPEVYLPYGQPAVLDCHFRANPPLKNLRWEKDGLLFDSYNVPGVFYKMNGSLFFAKVDENHAGSYTCTPFNDLGTDGPSPVISVIVLRPPIFSITPKAIYIQKLGETAELPCEAIDRDGNNRPTIEWKRKDGSPLPVNRHTVSGGNLTITNLIESDRGMYECSATNEAATITAETELMIENIAPRPPYNLTANSTETAITIRWQPDDFCLHVLNPKVGYVRPNLEYTVWYRLTDAPEWRTLRILQRNIMEATIQHLVPGREYEFMVLSQDQYGDGMFSKQFRFSTQESNNEASAEFSNSPHETNQLSSSPSAPWNLSLIKNPQGWLLHWEQPKRGQEHLGFYIVRWWKEPEHFLIGTAETFSNYYQLRNLKEEATFQIQVVVSTANGEEIPSELLTFEVVTHRKMRALVIGSSVCIMFLLCALCAFLYVKRNCLRHLFSGDTVDMDVEDIENSKESDKINNT